MEKVDQVSLKYTAFQDPYIKDGKMAVLLTDSYHGHIDDVRCDRTLIEMVIKEQEEIKNGTLEDCDYRKEINNYLTKLRGRSRPDTFTGICIEWVPINSYFTVTRCADDGESILVTNKIIWNKACLLN